MQTEASSFSPGAVAAAATTILEALDARRSIPVLSGANPPLSMADAYRISRAVTARRIARGERPIGRKIGFTNRTIWNEYNVHHPIDGPMYDTTVHHVSGVQQGLSLSRFVEPRIEPELVLGLSRAPQAGMTELEVIGCVQWIAHGFEIVQSLYPGWQFKGADCVAAFGLHGALICGPKWIVPQGDQAGLAGTLRRFTIRLSRNGELVDEGKAANVLDGPILALSHLVGTIAQDAEATPLGAGDIITTGTLTRAFPVSSGERWTTELTGIDLPGMDVTFAG
jgi:2-oxo-3-hexenedioate decarboxylase